MAVIHTLAAIGRFIRRTPPPPAELLEAYAHEVIPVLDRAEWLYEHWLEQSTLFTDGEKLGNVAAIHRWETATMGRSLERVIPPSVLADAHERVIDALELASRAAQLLSNGSRFHNANAVCEGQAMLAASRDRRLDALKAMRRYLARVQPSAVDVASVGAASSEMLAEAAGPVADADEAPSVDRASVEPVGDAASPEVLSRASPGEADPAAGALVAETEESWPEQSEPDLIWADDAGPEPAWLSAARADVATPDLSEAPPGRTGQLAREPAAAERASPTPVGDAERKSTVSDGVEGPVPESPAPEIPAAEGAAPNLPAPRPRPIETPAPNTGDAESSGRAAAPDPEAASRSGWGSLFGGTSDQSR